jgi:uncharacterized membrane protein
VFAWIVRGLLAVAAGVTQWFVAPASPQFGVVQGVVSLAVFVAVVFVLAAWTAWRGRD